MKDMLHFENDFPHNVLNEVNIAVLTLNEKLGLATPAELSKELDLEELAVGGIVNKLQEDQLLQFYNGLTLPSEKGKYEIDKLKKFDQIIANVFSFDGMLPAEEETIRNTLKDYRDNNYSSYLQTMRSLRVWRGLCAENIVLDCNTNILKEFSIAILIYDLKKIPQEADRLAEKPLYFSLQYYISHTPELSLISKAVLHLESFNALILKSDFGCATAPMKDFFEYLCCKDSFFADKIQSRVITALRARKNVNINHTYFYFFDMWKRDFFDGSEESSNSMEMDTASFLRGGVEKKNTVIDALRLVNKLSTALKQDELALMVRLYKKTGIITNTSLKEIHEFITTFLTTKDQLSNPVFKIKYDKIRPATIARCRQWLKKLMDELNNFKNGDDSEV